MNTNHQMNYYDYGKTLSAEGVMSAMIGGGKSSPTFPKSVSVIFEGKSQGDTVTVVFDSPLPLGCTKIRLNVWKEELDDIIAYNFETSDNQTYNGTLDMDNPDDSYGMFVTWLYNGNVMMLDVE